MLSLCYFKNEDAISDLHKFSLNKLHGEEAIQFEVYLQALDLQRPLFNIENMISISPDLLSNVRFVPNVC